MARPQHPVARRRARVATSQPREERLTEEWIRDGRFTVEQRSDGAVVVRVHSAGRGLDRLPDAVFAFRCGDPQYAFWLSRAEKPQLEER